LGTQEGARLAELVALLSLGTDLGLGHPMEHVMRQCLTALRLAEKLGLDEGSRGVVYYAGLLAWVGCHTDAHEQARWFGDDIAMKASFRTKGPAATMGRFGSDRSLLARVGLTVDFVRTGLRQLGDMLENHYVATDDLAARLGLGDDVRASLAQTFERWDGKGPLGLAGEEILVTARLIQVADVVTAFHRSQGTAAAIAAAKKRSGKELDPRLVQAFCDDAAAILRDVDATEAWEATLAAEPALAKRVDEGALDGVLEAIADFADLKSPWTIGHARSVAALSNDAAVDYGLPAPDVRLVRRAALVQDLGRLGVPNSILDKRGELTRIEQERMRMHPYVGERMLAYSPTLAPLASIAVQHHERLDGSGYPRGLSGDGITPAGRIVAAADVYRALVAKRPHRPARSTEEAERELRAMVSAGRLEGRAVDSVLRASGHRVRRRGEWPAGLTAREVEILRCIARGMSNKEIAAALSITPKTASSHVEHVYAKIGANNRARASLFAVKHGLMSE
jgi:HD-GYP domain-containing protein (c-di-GMP phosphodiesterase class II)